MPDTERPVAILGAGLIGVSWAALFLHHGFHVQAWDPDPKARDALEERVKAPIAQLRKLGAGADSLRRLTVHSELQRCCHVRFSCKRMHPNAWM